MLVSWKWLSKYVDLGMDREELETRLSLSGLNHEGTEQVNDDFSIDLEVTSNRGDCLGHIGVAREISVLYGTKLRVPDPKIGATSSQSIRDVLSVENTFPEGCPRYTARVIKGVKIGPSPDWMIQELQSAIHLYKSINNVVDVTNYVLMECGQPLHAFDMSKINGEKIVVRRAAEGEKIQAIDHNEYELDDAVCVIADEHSPLAIAGVMGGAGSEVDDSTTDIIIEAAVFDPLGTRRTARKLKLHSPSSYRFERKVDPVGVEWASRRACELIQELAGGEVLEGMIDTAAEIAPREPIVLRASELERILGIKIDSAEVVRILTELGCGADNGAYAPPSWRHDLTREADLIEEVARIYGYDKIPENAPIPVAPSQKRPFDVAMARIRAVLTSAGISEAMTPSVVTEKLDQSISPWTELPALQTQTQMLKGSRRLRRSLIPSLLEGRAKNWTAASLEASLFEIAHIYLPGNADDTLPAEQYCLGVVAGGDYYALKGAIETLLGRLGVQEQPVFEPTESAGFAKNTAVQIKLGGTLLGFMAMVDAKVLKQWKLPGPVVAAELALPVLMEASTLVPQQQAVSLYPSIQRDLNFIMNESVRWSELENVVRAAVGAELAAVDYRETYRDENKDGRDRKRVLLSVELQSHERTLSGEQADDLIQKVIGACKKTLGADLLS